MIEKLIQESCNEQYEFWNIKNKINEIIEVINSHVKKEVKEYDKDDYYIKTGIEFRETTKENKLDEAIEYLDEIIDCYKKDDPTVFINSLEYATLINIILKIRRLLNQLKKEHEEKIERLQKDVKG